VVGPVDDGVPQNQNVSNYWFEADSFPIVNDPRMSWKNFYLHKDGKVNNSAPTQDEGAAVFVDDPNNPVWTVGGANMIVETPSGDRISQGQMQMNHPDFAPYCLDRPGVLQFETDVISDSLCVIGYPKVSLFARSNPAGLTSGETDADYFVRMVDVYPDGREFFVFEGCVNARARDYAKHIYDTGVEDPNIPFTNIEIGKIYEYKFEMMPIAYTWGKNHKMKILIQGSNNPRYQSNPHIPLHTGDFFRRQPNDGKSYTYNGQSLLARTSVERIFFAPDKATRIELPVFKGYGTAIETPPQTIEDRWQVVAYPNPADAELYVACNQLADMTVSITNLAGQQVMQENFREQARLDISQLPAGFYFVTVLDTEGTHSVTKKITVK
jgi:putative CocE/NonD family hydrolase